MAEKVRGLTIEISADATKFKKQLGEVSKEAKSTQTEFNALKKGLEIEFDATKFEKAQKLAQKAIDETKNKANILTQRLEYLEGIGSADTAEYKRLAAELAQTDTQALRLQKDLEALNKIKLDNLTSGIDKISSGLTKAGKAMAPFSAAAGGALAGLSALGLKAVSTADDIATTATQLGMTAEELQKMRYVALQTDVDIEKLNKGFIKARATLADMATGTVNNATKALEKLNLNLSNFKSSDEAFYGIIDALSKMDNELEMAAVANEVFGDKIANDLIPLIKAGGDAIGEYAAEFENMGGLTNAQVATLAEFDNVMNKIKTQFSNITLQIGTAFLPVLETAAGVLQDKIIPLFEKLSNWIKSLSDNQLNMIAKILLIVAAAAPLLLILGKVAGGISAIMKLIPALNSMMSTLAANPIIAIIGVIATLIMILYSTNEQFRESLNQLIGMLLGSLAPILDIIMKVLQSLIEAITPLIDMIGNALAGVLTILLDVLTPVFDMLAFIFDLIQPLIDIALIPLQMALQGLSIPLQLLGTLLNWLMPLFNMFAKLIKGVFDFIMKIVNKVLGFVENAINWAIDKINKVIEGINKMAGWLGLSLSKIDNVSLQFKADGLDDINDASLNTGDAPNSSGSPYDIFQGTDGNGTYINNDYSTSNKTQHVTVVIENYAAEIDVDDMVNKINLKLAEAM